MNERLIQLMAEADYPADELTLRTQKLVESVVRECASICYNTDSENADGMALLLLSSFGINDD